MKKQVLMWILFAVFLWGLPLSAYADKVRIEVDGKRVADLGASTLVEDEIWVPLRELSIPFGMEFSRWDKETETLTVCTPHVTVIAQVGDQWLTANGVCFPVQGEVLGCRGGVLVPLDVLCSVFDASWHREGGNRAAVTISDAPKIPDASIYDPEDLYWLSRIVYAESGGESFECQLAVAEVVLNRVESEWYPDDVYGVVFDQENGVQFTPTENGSIYNEPSEESIAAAKLALGGSQTMPDDVLFFVSTLIGPNWVSEARTFVMQIGITDFYA